MNLKPTLSLLWLLISTPLAIAQNTTITIDASQHLKPISRLLSGACIEDVNHEIYGGIYSQMIFGESFQEPPAPIPIKNFTNYGGYWILDGDVLTSTPGQGTKLIANDLELVDGTASVDIKFSSTSNGNMGLILRTSKPRVGANDFFGYEVSLDPSGQIVRLGRHRNNWEHIRDIPCEIKPGDWKTLRVDLKGNRLEAFVNDVSMFVFEDPDNKNLETGGVGLREWGHAAQIRNLKITKDGNTTQLPFAYATNEPPRNVSGMWRAATIGSPAGDISLETASPFVGTQSQRIVFESGTGSIGIANYSLNGWGMHFQSGKSYEGVLYAKANKPGALYVSAESNDGTQVLAEQKLDVTSTEWTRIDFALTPNATLTNGRLALRLKQSADITHGYVSLHPGSWGRFKDLPVRKDIAEGLQKQGVRILRYGGSMVNNPEYRWKKMIGPRELRQPYHGFWYPYSTNGWGIIDFMNFCEAAGFEYCPTFTMHESVQDIADFIHYAKDPVSTPWGKRRSDDGHPDPYRLNLIQLGNEERVDENYATKFKAMAEAIWALDKNVTIVVGDFVYMDPIKDPSNVNRAASGITNLDGQKKVLQTAKANNREVWFDVHVWTGGPRPDSSFDSMFSYIDALESLADGAKFKVLTFEFNSNNHDQRRAIANAYAVNAIERDGRLPISTVANCLQPDGQNDNGWDQGLLFLNPSQVWLQPPGYVTQMYSNNYCETLVKCDVAQNPELDCNAKLSSDGKTLVLNIVNFAAQPVTTDIKLSGFKSSQENADWTELAAPLDAVNTATKQDDVVPTSKQWQHTLADGSVQATFQPFSVTSIRIR
jgi:alpha-L-arabinofuranosidase